MPIGDSDRPRTRSTRQAEKKGAGRGVGTMGYKSHPIGNATGMISLVSALVIEHGEKKIETERVTEAGLKKFIPRDEREGKLKARDRKMDSRK